MSMVDPYSVDEIAYELYKLDWVNKHISAEIQLKIYREYLLDFNDAMFHNGKAESFEEWLWNFDGYNGLMYACYEEFCDEEYLDEEYMKLLLKDEMLIRLYLEDVLIRKCAHEE